MLFSLTISSSPIIPSTWYSSTKDIIIVISPQKKKQRIPRKEKTPKRMRSLSSSSPASPYYPPWNVTWHWTFVLLLCFSPPWRTSSSMSVVVDAAECQTCQVDQDCLVALNDNDNNNNETDTTTSTSSSSLLLFSICDIERQLCVNPNNLLDIDCPCSNGEDCNSGRCEGFFGFATCQELIPNGEGCNEDSDCLSGQCNTFFQCQEQQQELVSRLPNGEICSEDSDCMSGQCSSNDPPFICVNDDSASTGSISPEPAPSFNNCSRLDDQLLEDGCPCWNGEDCNSGRCEGIFGFATCQELIPNGEECNEDSDCISGRCSYPQFICVDDDSSSNTTMSPPSNCSGLDLLMDGCPCLTSYDCGSGICNSNNLCEESDDDGGSTALAVGLLVAGLLAVCGCCMWCANQSHRRANGLPPNIASNVCDCCECCWDKYNPPQQEHPMIAPPPPATGTGTGTGGGGGDLCGATPECSSGVVTGGGDLGGGGGGDCDCCGGCDGCDCGACCC